MPSATQSKNDTMDSHAQTNEDRASPVRESLGRWEHRLEGASAQSQQCLQEHQGTSRTTTERAEVDPWRAHHENWPPMEQWGEWSRKDCGSWEQLSLKEGGLIEFYRGWNFMIKNMIYLTDDIYIYIYFDSILVYMQMIFIKKLYWNSFWRRHIYIIWKDILLYIKFYTLYIYIIFLFSALRNIWNGSSVCNNCAYLFVDFYRLPNYINKRVCPHFNAA